MRVSSTILHVLSQKSYRVTQNIEIQSQTPSLKVEVMMKQIRAVVTSGTEQFEFWVGISLGLYDTSALTVTIGLDLEEEDECRSEQLSKLFWSKSFL